MIGGFVQLNFCVDSTGQSVIQSFALLKEGEQDDGPAYSSVAAPIVSFADAGATRQETDVLSSCLALQASRLMHRRDCSDMERSSSAVPSSSSARGRRTPSLLVRLYSCLFLGDGVFVTYADCMRTR